MAERPGIEPITSAHDCRPGSVDSSRGTSSKIGLRPRAEVDMKLGKG